MNDITSFSDENRWLSNFYPCSVFLDGEKYLSVEFAYVAAKTLDPQIRETIRGLTTSGKAKRFGMGMELRPDWDDVKLSIMDNLLRQKFAYGTDLARQLVETGKVQIIEGNSWGDTFWGVCGSKGSNHLGKLIMKIRNELPVKLNQFFEFE